MIKPGPVVHNMWAMWPQSVEPAAIDAKLVESDSGDNLSPKYAPDNTAPAAIGIERFKPIATPIRATPMVPAEPHDVPVQVDTKAVSKNAETQKYDGSIYFKPQ